MNEWKIMLVKDEVEVEALPQDLPSKFEIDVSVIQTVNDVFFVKDLKVSDKVTILDDPELPILTVSVIEDEPAEEGTSETTEETQKAE